MQMTQVYRDASLTISAAQPIAGSSCYANRNGLHIKPCNIQLALMLTGANIFNEDIRKVFREGSNTENWLWAFLEPSPNEVRNVRPSQLDSRVWVLQERRLSVFAPLFMAKSYFGDAAP